MGAIWAAGRAMEADECLQTHRPYRTGLWLAPTATPPAKGAYISYGPIAPQWWRGQSTHARIHDGGARSTAHSAPASSRRNPLLLQARLSLGLAHVSSEHASVSSMLADRRLVVTRSMHWRLAHTATMVAYADASCRPLHDGGAGRTASLGISKSSPQDAVAPRGRGGSHGVCRNSGLAALLRVGVGVPQWWYSPTAATMVARPRQRVPQRH